MAGLSEVPLVLRIWRQTFRCNLNTVREQRRRCVPEILLKGRVELHVVCIVEKPIQLQCPCCPAIPPNLRFSSTHILLPLSPRKTGLRVLSPSKTIVYS